MANISNLGSNVGVIYNMPIYTEYFLSQKEKLDKIIKNGVFSYLMAITANRCQKDSGDLLKKNGFKNIVTFYSSHAGAKENNETLTLWVKIQKDKKSSLKKIITPGWNCSISYNYLNPMEQDRRIFIWIKKNENDIPPGFKNIAETPIYYKIEEKYLVK